MTFHFTPRRLIEATARLVRAHPVRQTQLSDPTQVVGSHPHIINKLREKINHTPHEQLEDLTSQFDALERIVLPLLHLDRSEDIRLKTLAIVESDLALADVDRLLVSFISYPTSTEAGRVTRLLHDKLKIGTTKTHQSWHPILASHVNSQHEFNKEVIKNGIRNNAPISFTLNNAKIPPQSPLATLLTSAVLSVGPEAWQTHGVDIACQTFEFADLSTRLNAYKAAKSTFDSNINKQICVDFCIRNMENFNNDHKLREVLRLTQPDVWHWVQSLLLGQFFGAEKDVHGRERYLFWRQYVNSAIDIRLNTIAGRLFMEFKEFGIVDFLQPNNALYVYDKIRFKMLIEMDISNPRLDTSESQRHVSFKSQRTCIQRWSHSGKWQSNFRHGLSKLDITPS